MRIEKKPYEQRRCKKCYEKLEDDWMYDECDACMLNEQKKMKIIKGAVIGGSVLALSSVAGVAGVLLYRNKKNKF